MEQLDSEEIEHWSEEYDANYDGKLREIEQTLNKVLAEQHYITQDQLEQIIIWKLDAQPGRRDKNIEKMNAVPDQFIRQLSGAALLLNDPKTQLDTLTCIPGIGNATATLVLAFYDPANYAIGDRYIVDALLGEDRGMRLTDYPKILKELRDRNPGGLDIRTVERVYYQKYRHEQNVGRW